jgi:hypothetical protein
MKTLLTWLQVLTLCCLCYACIALGTACLVYMQPVAPEFEKVRATHQTFDTRDWTDTGVGETGPEDSILIEPVAVQ